MLLWIDTKNRLLGHDLFPKSLASYLLTKEYIANRLFESIEKLENVLNNLLNEGGLIIKWDRKLKNKGNAVNVV